MRRLENVISNPIDISPNPLGNDPKIPRTAPRAVGGSKVPLPRTVEGLEGVWADASVPDVVKAHSSACKLALTYKATLAIPLIGPTDEELGKLGAKKGRQTETFQRYLLAVSLRLPTGSEILGICVMTVHVNGLGMGQNKIIEFCPEWTMDQCTLLMRIASYLHRVPSSVPASPSGGEGPLNMVVFLLVQDLTHRARQWKRELDLLGALLGLKIHVIFRADDIQRDVERELKASPPDALLVSTRQLRHSNSFQESYKRVRPSGIVDEFELDMDTPWTTILDELSVHLYLISISPVVHQDEVSDWVSAHRVILSMEGPHFVLSDRAKRNLPRCKYPDPARMIEHVRRLADLAQDYHSSDGKLGARLEEVAIQRHGIQIALTDGRLKTREIYVDKKSQGKLRAEPHVKVDDAKSPADCGRIYFAIDQVNFSFVVDHIGLHDYS